MFFSCHNHTAMGSNIRGFLDSTNSGEDLIQYHKELGHLGLAFTDHDAITAHMDALDCINGLRKEDNDKWKDFKIALGNEIYLCSRKQIEEEKVYRFWHFILIAKDEVGHQQIRELSTRAWTENSFMWVNIRTPTYYEDLFDVVENDRGHLIAGSACLGGFLSNLILTANQENPDSPNYDSVKKWIKRMVKCFGEGNFFLEMQPSNQEDQIVVNNVIFQLSNELNVPYIITTDCLNSFI